MNVNQMVSQKLIDRLKKSEVSGEKFYWVKPFARGCPRTAVSYETQKEYRGINRILLDSSKEYISYGQLQRLNEKGKDFYHLRKGCHGNTVVFYTTIPQKDEDGEVIIDKDTNEPKTKSILRYYTVFDREDVVNEQGVNLPSKFPIQQYDHTDEEDRKRLAIAKFNAIVKSYLNKYGITLEEINEGTEAYYMPSKNLIRLPNKESFPTLSSYMATCFHELIHSTMKPLERKVENHSMQTYCFEELVAELGSAILMAQMDMPTEQTEENNLAYLQGWSSYLSEKNTALIKASSQAEKAVDLILSEFEHQLAYLQEVDNTELTEVPSIETELIA